MGAEGGNIRDQRLKALIYQSEPKLYILVAVHLSRMWRKIFLDLPGRKSGWVAGAICYTVLNQRNKNAKLYKFYLSWRMNG